MKTYRLKKFAAIFGSSLTLSALIISPAKADNATQLLQRIAVATEAAQTSIQNILLKVDKVPDIYNTLFAMSQSLTAPDKTSDTAFLQEQFANTGKYIADDTNNQLATYQDNSFDSAMFNGATQGDIPGAATLFHSALLGTPVKLPPKLNSDGTPGTPETPPTNPALSFMKNAAGHGIFHRTPGTIHGGDPEDVQRYASYFRTVVPAQSYNTYVLSKLYAESLNQQALTNAQMQLVAKVSDSKWLAKVGSNDIGVIFRQILMFQSQSYVLMTQMLKTQKEMLTLQAINNSLLIAGNIRNEKKLLNNALSKTEGMKD